MAGAKGGSRGRSSQGRTTAALLVRTPRGIEVRCPVHGHLLGVLNEANQLVIKCGDNEFVGRGGAGGELAPPG